MNIILDKDDINCICITVNQINDSTTLRAEGHSQELEEQSNLSKQSNMKTDLETANG